MKRSDGIRNTRPAAPTGCLPAIVDGLERSEAIWTVGVLDSIGLARAAAPRSPSPPRILTRLTLIESCSCKEMVELSRSQVLRACERSMQMRLIGVDANGTAWHERSAYLAERIERLPVPLRVQLAAAQEHLRVRAAGAQDAPARAARSAASTHVVRLIDYMRKIRMLSAKYGPKRVAPISHF